MLSVIRKIVHAVSTSKGAKITIGIWLLAVICLSVVAPGSSDYKENSTEGSVKEDLPSEIAQQFKEETFPSDEGLTGLIVFHDENGLSKEEKETIEEFSEWIDSDDKPNNIAASLPFHQFPAEIQDEMISKDDTTLLFNITLKDGIESNDIQTTLNDVTNKWETDFRDQDSIQFEITGPAAISADTLSLFQNADFVLMFATVALIFVILIIIYRSPLLAITPLIIAGIVYGVVDRILGIAGKFDLFPIEGQAVSIMLVLLFAVVTDYSLFIFSRYREELQRVESKYHAMKEAIHHVSEPIFFSGGTVILAMLTLFVTVFKPYHYFAPVFSVAVVCILIAGLTLIPALFALLGRKAFWPSIPKVEKNEKKQRHLIWGWAGKNVIKHPKKLIILIVAFLAIGIINVFPIQFSFNLLKSFPDDITSRAGFEILEDHYPAGRLAPLTILLENDQKVDTTFLENVQVLQQGLEDLDGINSVNSALSDKMVEGEDDLPRGFLSDNEQVVQFDVVLSGNPYEESAFDTVDQLRSDEQDMLHDFSGNVHLYLAGQTAEQLDVHDMNKRDMIILFSLVIVLLTVVLIFQTKSILLPSVMMGTIVLSYIATLGFGWIIFHYLLNYDAISYRLPVYTFVFMVALGIDYNILLVSRIKEFAKDHNWIEAVRRGVTQTGGVISSAGIILAATFSVLMTQPIQELFLFGFIMAMGILLDTFIIRGFLLPSILVVTHKRDKKG